MEIISTEIMLDCPAGKKIYFSSDNHLGAPNKAASKEREHIFLKWLNRIEKDAAALFLLGDLFDFWFEYKTVVPKGFTRVLGKIASFTDRGIPVYFFVGNHDLWMRDYFQEELGLSVFFKPCVFQLESKRFFIGHGDGLGPGDAGYKRMKKLFTNPVAQWFYRWLHPDIGVRLAQYLSVKNKLISGEEDVLFLGEDKEWLVQYCKEQLETQEIDCFVFGHRHLPLDIKLNNTSRYINIGDWVSHYTFGVFDGTEMSLETFKE